MIDPATVATAIEAALGAGALAALQSTAGDAIKDAYGRLKSLIQKHFAGNEAATYALTQHEKKPTVYKDPLIDALNETHAAADPAIIAATSALQDALKAAGTNVAGRDVITAIASGERSVAFGGGMSGGTITTGDVLPPNGAGNASSAKDASRERPS
jgi:hypothetical protein